MKLVIRRLILIGITLILITAVIIISLFGGAILKRLIEFIVPPGKPGQNIIPYFDIEFFWQLSFISFIVAFIFSMFYLFWSPGIYKKKLFIPFLIFLITLMSFSIINFLTFDQLMHRWAQAIIDLIIIFLGLTVLQYLLKLSPRTYVGITFHTIIVFIIVLEALIIPGIYAIIFIFNLQGLINHSSTIGFGMGWISIISYIITTGIAVINVIKNKENIKCDKSEEEKKIKV